VTPLKLKAFEGDIEGVVEGDIEGVVEGDIEGASEEGVEKQFEKQSSEQTTVAAFIATIYQRRNLKAVPNIRDD